MDAPKQLVSPYLRFLFGLPKGHIFTTRDLLPFAARATIDKAMSRMVRSGMLERLARGVFRFFDPQNKRVSLIRIAAIKRKAFGRKLATVANYIKEECLVRLEDKGREKLEPAQVTMVSDGRTSAFLIHTSGKRVRLKSVTPRLLGLGESLAGRAMRDLWLIGKYDLDKSDVDDILQDIPKREKRKITGMKKLLPQWLTELLPESPIAELESLMVRPPRRKTLLKMPAESSEKSTEKLAGEELKVSMEEPRAPMEEPKVPMEEPKVPINESQVPIVESAVPIDEPAVPRDIPEILDNAPVDPDDEWDENEL